MAQSSIGLYFNARKRAAAEEIVTSRNKVQLLNKNNGVPSFNLSDDDKIRDTIETLTKRSATLSKLNDLSGSNELSKRTRSGRLIKRIGVLSEEPDEKLQPQNNIATPKIANFFKMGNLSPQKKVSTPKKQDTKSAATTLFLSRDSDSNIERGMKTPVKQIKSSNDNSDITEVKMDKISVAKELSLNEIKNKIKRSSKLNELKASLKKIQEMDKNLQNAKFNKIKPCETVTSQSPVKNLKEFSTMEIEVPISPKPLFKTPNKWKPSTPMKDELMSPKSTITPRKLTFSPTKSSNLTATILSPRKETTIPAYQKYQSLSIETKFELPLPYKYRCLAEMFRCLDTVCSMYFNRSESITFKKIKPAIQRMLRKNFTEDNLAQIKTIYPESYTYMQVKMRNFGSTSKQDYYQLTLKPKLNLVNNLISDDKKSIKHDDDNIIRSAELLTMNPQILLQRCQIFNSRLTEFAKDEHEKFLANLQPPMIIPRHKILRWHALFDLENCPDVLKSELPQPPNVEKFSSAKDVLSTARNLFNCSTQMDRALERLEAKKKLDNETNSNETIEKEIKPEEPIATALKGIPKSLLEKIRAKQAAKELEAITRRPSQDIEAIKFGRLPELARHLRNVFVTDKKSVLPLEVILKKLLNSYRANLNIKELEEHLHLLADTVPDWIAIHIIRKTKYIKLSKNDDLSKLQTILENIAKEKAK